MDTFLVHSLKKTLVAENFNKACVNFVTLIILWLHVIFMLRALKHITGKHIFYGILLKISLFSCGFVKIKVDHFNNSLFQILERPLELPLFEIVPGIDQIVFEGDKIPFDCQASIVDPRTQMFWLRNGLVVETNRSRGVFIHTRRSPDNTVMMHSMVLENLKSPNSGEWLCLVSTPQVL